MAKRYSLSAFTFHFRRVRDDEHLIMSRNGECDGWSLLSRYFRTRLDQLVKLEDYATTEDTKSKENRVLKVVDSFEEEGDRVLWGSALTGDSGTANEIIDITTSVTSFNKRKVDADMPPYTYYFFVPDGARKGVALLQKIGAGSLKGALYRDMQKYFQRYDLIFNLKPVTDLRVYQDYLTGGELTGLVLTTYAKQEESRRLLARSRVAGSPLATGTEMKLVLRPAELGDRAMNFLRGVLEGDTLVEQLVEIEGMSDPDLVSVDVKYGNKTRRFDIVNKNASGVSYSLDGVVTIGENGYPTLGSVKVFADELADDIADTVIL